MIYKQKELLKKLNFASIGVTWQCNARCKACTVWEIEKEDYMLPKHYAKLPQLKDINITGGEPFLRKDLVEVIDVIHKHNKNARLVFSSNGMLSNLIVDKVKEIKKKLGARMGIRISIDGIEKIHERSRGITGAFDKAMTTIEKLKQLEVNDLGLAFTLADDNIDQLEKVYDLSKNLKIQFTFCGITHNSEVLFGENVNKPLWDFEKLQQQLTLFTKKCLCSYNIKSWYRAFYHAGIYYHAKTGKRNIPCEAGKAFFYMHPNGDIFPDMVLNKKFGNLEKQTFEDIWFGNNAQEFRKWISNINNCQKHCWMVCTVSPWMINNKFKLLPWIIKNKFKAHLNNFKIEDAQFN